MDVRATPPPEGRALFRRRSFALVAHGARSAFLLAIFTGALAGGVVLHANTPSVRRIAVRVTNRVAGRLFEGKIVVGEVHSISLGATSHARIRDVDVKTDNDQPVLHAHQVEASIDLRRLLRALATHRPADVVLNELRIDELDLRLDADAREGTSIARAFRAKGTPVAPTPPATERPENPATPTTAPEAPPRTPTVRITRASIGRGQLRGNLVPPELDGTISDFQGRVDLEEGKLAFTLESTGLTLHSPRAPNQTAPMTGTARGVFGMDLATARLTGKADVVGACGAVPVVAHAELDGDKVDATVDIARTTPDAIATAFANLPLSEPGELHARAHGILPTIAIDARAKLGAANVSASGEIDLRAGKAFKLDVDAAQLDARAFGTDLETKVSGKIHVDGTLEGGGGPLASFRIVTAESQVAGEHIPATTVEGRFEAQRVTAVLRTSERNAYASGKVTFDIPTQVSTFDLQARSDSLRTLARLPTGMNGAASARAQGKVDLAKRTIFATTTMSADDLSTVGFSANRISANGVISGPLTSPSLDVGFAGVGLELRAENKTPLVYPTATGSAKIALVPTPRVVEASINVGYEGSSEGVTASAQGVQVVNGVVEARNVYITGLGAPLELDARIGKGQWKIRAKSSRVDLHRVARMTGIRELSSVPDGTHALVDVDFQQKDGWSDGHIDLIVETDTGLFGNSVVAEAHAKIERNKLTGSAKVAADGFGKLEVIRAEVDVPSRLDARSLQRATGDIELRGTVDLSQGAALLAGDTFEHILGMASFEARIQRGDPAGLPAIRGTIRSSGLDVKLSGLPPEGTDPAQPQPPPLHIAGIDLLTHFAWDGRTNDAEVSLLAWDKHGLVSSAGAKARVPLIAWVTGAERFDAKALAGLDVSFVADLPMRDVAALPSFLELPLIQGKVGGHVEADGKLDRPHVVVSAHASGLREDRRTAASRRVALEPVDGTLEAHWDGERAAVTFALDERARRARRPTLGSRSVPGPQMRAQTPTKGPGHVRGLAIITDVRMTDLLRGKAPAELPWVASAEVEVEDVQLGALPLPADVTGLLHGRARVKNLNRDASIEARAHVDDFGSGNVIVQSLDLTAGGRNASLFAHASIADQESAVTFQLASQSPRIEGFKFGWDETAPTRLDYAVQNGQLALLAPLVRSAVSELDGRVDGTGSVTIDRTAQVFEGGLAIQDARLYVNVLGEEITSLNATARFERTGVFRIDNAMGKVGAGEFRASANGRMKGFRFMGADATLVATKEGIPISAEGATFAEATGEVKISANMTEDRRALDVAVDIPRAEVRLPDRNTQSLQRLDADSTVAIGVRDQGGRLDTTASRRRLAGRKQARTDQDNAVDDALVTRMNVRLGEGIHLEGRGIDVTLVGRTLVEVAEEVRVTGQLDLRGGSVEVHGRRFTVDRGVVTFPDGGEIDNPTIVGAAYWDAPDRTRVWVEFTGPLKGGQITLRSEPPLLANEILSVILFGRPDPNVAAAGTGSTAGTGSGGANGKHADASGAATAVGTGFVAADVNRLLSELDQDLDIETDTLSGNRTRAKLGRSFFDRRLKVQVGYAPGRTMYQPDTAFVFLNWQFIPKWSVVATQGDRGTSILDVLFQHRY